MRFIGLAGGWPADDTSSEANGVTSVPAPSPSKAACTTNAPIRSTWCEVPPFTHALRAHPPGGALGAALCGRRRIWRRLRWEASCGQRLNLVARGPGEMARSTPVCGATTAFGAAAGGAQRRYAATTVGTAAVSVHGVCVRARAKGAVRCRVAHRSGTRMSCDPCAQPGRSRLILGLLGTVSGRSDCSWLSSLNLPWLRLSLVRLALDMMNPASGLAAKMVIV